MSIESQRKIEELVYIEIVSRGLFLQDLNIKVNWTAYIVVDFIIGNWCTGFGFDVDFVAVYFFAV